mgnify:CR=1 FL=1
MCECCVEKKDIYLPQLATVEDVSQMNATEKYLRLSMDDGQFDFIPGQFVEVSIAGIGEAPITISSSPTQTNGIELVIRRIGNVSNASHNLQKGDKLGIRGPLGPGGRFALGAGAVIDLPGLPHEQQQQTERAVQKQPLVIHRRVGLRRYGWGRPRSAVGQLAFEDAPLPVDARTQT